MTNKSPVASDPVVQRFGARLREARGSRTLRDVSVESGVSIAYISDLERGNLQNPSLATLRKIAAALRVSLDALLGEPPVASEAARRDVPDSLLTFVEGRLFAVAVRDMAERWKLDGERLAADWLDVLAAIDVAGRRPESEADWMFVFEAVRRAVDR